MTFPTRIQFILSIQTNYLSFLFLCTRVVETCSGGYVHLQRNQQSRRMNNMQLTVNGEELDFSAGNTVGQLLAQLHLLGRPAAVEKNGQIVPHSVFDQTELTEGDTLEVVTLVGGG